MIFSFDFRLNNGVRIMSFLELAKKRGSVRKYRDVGVEDSKLRQVLEAGRVAPSAVNFQPWYFIVARDEVLRRQVATAYKRDWILQAPVIVVICGDHRKAWKRFDEKDHCDIDAAIAIDHMTLAATELGLGTCWVCAFNPQIIRDVFRLPEYIEPIALLPIGYPSESTNENRHDSERRPLDEIVFWDGFGGK
jgi:nitroreductase